MGYKLNIAVEVVTPVEPSVQSDTTSTCPVCEGVDSDVCHFCDGTGTISQEELSTYDPTGV
jgi:DnaJ-class molecular chaperone